MTARTEIHMHRLPVRLIPALLAGLAVVAAVVVWAIPPEAKLGETIRIVLLHGALARTGIVMLGLAAMAGGVALVLRRPGLDGVNRTLQTTALGVWVVYFASSIVATWMTWGVPVAWAEPRTQASIKILLLVVVFYLVTRYVAQPVLTQIANLVAGLAAFFLIRSAGAVQHPVNPVMGADAAIFPILFVTLWGLLTVMALLAARWLHVRTEARSVPAT